MSVEAKEGSTETCCSVFSIERNSGRIQLLIEPESPLFGLLHKQTFVTRVEARDPLDSNEIHFQFMAIIG